MQPFSNQPSILLKNEAHVRPSCRSAENFNIFTGKPCLFSLRKTLRPLLIDGPQQSTTQSPRVSGTHLINLGRMKGWLDLRATLWFLTWDPGLEILHLKNYRPRAYPCNFIKNNSTTELFLHVFCRVAFFKLSGNLLWHISAKHFLTKS